jgi:hypothetical protein
MHPTLRSYWPEPGSRWKTVADFQLAAQLACLRVGFAGAIRHRHGPTRWSMRCRHENRKNDGCQALMVTATMVDAARPEGVCKVDHNKEACFDISQHAKHSHPTFKGLSVSLLVRRHVIPFG